MDIEHNLNELSFHPSILRGKLSNGLNYFIMENKKPKNRILAWLIVPVGAIHEKDNEKGIAHFIEHMGFKGTKNFPPGKLMKYFQTIGVDMGESINGITGIDRTIYKIEIPSKEYLTVTLQALCDFASYMLFLPEEIEKERDVILEEFRFTSNLEERLYKKYKAIKFKGSAYEERDSLGTEETVKKMTSRDLHNFYSYWYRPDIMGLIIVGDCKSSEVKKKIKNIFGQIQKSTGEKPVLKVPFNPHKKIYTGIITDEELKESSISIYYLRDQHPLKTEEDFRKILCEELIFKMINMRLSQESYINTNTPIIYGGGCIYRNIKSFNEVRFMAQVTSGREMEALEIFFGYIEGIHQKGFSSMEKKETETQFLEELRKGKERKDTRESQHYAKSLMEAFIKEGLFISADDCYNLACEIFQDIKDEEIQKFTDYLLNPINMSVIITSPQGHACNIKKDKILKTVNRVINGDVIDYKFKELNYSYDYSSIKPGEILSRQTYKDITELRFANGLTVLLKPSDFEKNKVYFCYVSIGGKLLEPPENPGIFEIARSAWAEGGTEDLNQIEIERLLRLKAISFNNTGNVLYGLRGHCPEKALEELCQWGWQYLIRPGYREEAIDYSIRSTIENIRQMEQSQEGLLLEAENRILLPHNPLSIIASEKDLIRYKNPDDLKKFHLLSSVPSNSQLTLIGSFDIDYGIYLASKYFGSLSPGKNPFIPSCYFKTEFPRGNTKRIIYKGKENRAIGRIIFPGCMKEERDEISLELLAKILSIRYWNNIRENNGLVYSINVENYSPILIKGYGKFSISFGTDPDKVDYVRDCIMDDINDISCNGVIIEELEIGKKILSSLYEEDIENNNYWMSELYGAGLFKLNMERIFNYKDRISKVENKDIQAVTTKYLSRKNNIFLTALPY